MKHLVFLSTWLLMSLFARAQTVYDCVSGNPPAVTLDSFYFESGNSGKARLVIDTSFPGNIWQIGTVQKAGFAGALSGTHALQTDTLNPYPVRNTSAAALYFDANAYSEFSLSFWHYYDTDTLTDSCLVQISSDSGKTWSTVTPGAGWPTIYYNGSLNGYLNDPVAVGVTDTLFWSGNSSGWRKESICAAKVYIKGMQLPRKYGIRFLFHSDSIQTNKPGWMIDNIRLRSPDIFNGIGDIGNKRIMAYPNPTHNGWLHLDYPHDYVTGTVVLFNSYGQKVRELPLAPTISIAELPKGLYHYQVTFADTQQQFAGTLLYE